MEGDEVVGEGSEEVVIVRPRGEGRPVESSVGDETGLVRGHEFPKESERRGRSLQPLNPS